MHIIPKWKEHPLTKQGLVELVPTDWLYQYHGTDVTLLTEIKDGSVVTMEELWENIKREGLHDPVIIRIGIKNKKFRLEAGNHRIYVLHTYGILFTPATVQIQDWCGPDAENVMNTGTHNFDFLQPITLTEFAHGYTKPSTVFTELINRIQR